MSIIVKKFGGTSVGSTERIINIARHLAEDYKNNDDIVTVVSAMGQTTNELLSLAYQISHHPNQREMDMLVTAGERITMALLSLALQELNIPSISFTGSQSGIITDNSHGNAKILTVNAYRIPEELKKDKIVIVAGFQGVSLEKEITTLGRGGSDTTAVALACFLKARKCEIFTDVDGVYTADPRRVNKVTKINRLSYEEMLYMTYTGSKVLHSRAAEFAYKYQIPIEIKSSFDATEGTMIDHQMEDSVIKTISHKDNIIIFNIKKIKNGIPAFTTEIFDMELDNSDLKIYIEQKYETKFLDELSENALEYQKSDTLYCVINLLGYRICRDIHFFSQLNDDLMNICNNTFKITNQGIGVQIMIDQAYSTKVLEEINNKYIP